MMVTESAYPFPRLLVAGGTGRLGSAVVRRARQAGFPRVDVLSRGYPSGNPLDGTTAWYPPADVERAVRACDVYISTATSEAEEAYLPAAIRAERPVVVATTGLSEAARALVGEAASHIPIVAEPNYSPGILGIERALQVLASEGSYEVGVLEVHRRQKRDAPSATALSLAETWIESSGSSATPGIASLRLGEVPGFHQIFLSAEREWIRIEHQAFDPDVFASGILRTALALHRLRGGLSPGRYRAAELWARSGVPV